VSVAGHPTVDDAPKFLVSTPGFGGLHFPARLGVKTPQCKSRRLRRRAQMQEVTEDVSQVGPPYLAGVHKSRWLTQPRLAKKGCGVSISSMQQGPQNRREPSPLATTCRKHIGTRFRRL
jgi:hypothetical protein